MQTLRLFVSSKTNMTGFYLLVIVKKYTKYKVNGLLYYYNNLILPLFEVLYKTFNWVFYAMVGWNYNMLGLHSWEKN